jgi:hypothetical protein
MTDLTFVLDRSGSMESLKNEAVGGFNSFLESQKAVPGECNFTFIQFDDRYENHFSGRLAEVPELRLDNASGAITYAPRGMTALLDAFGKTINAIGSRLDALPENAKPGTVIVVTLTDGLENASQEFDRQSVRAMIERQQNVYSWKFIFLGAGIDAMTEGAELGIAPKYTQKVAHSGKGICTAYSVTDSYVRELRTEPNFQEPTKKG